MKTLNEFLKEDKKILKEAVYKSDPKLEKRILEITEPLGGFNSAIAAALGNMKQALALVPANKYLSSDPFATIESCKDNAHRYIHDQLQDIIDENENNKDALLQIENLITRFSDISRNYNLDLLGQIKRNLKYIK